MAERSTERCVVCDAQAVGAPRSTRTARVTVRGRSITLCRSHAGQVAVQMPRTWEDLRAVFATGAERRSPIPRRAPPPDDRRVFPPRPEGRRAEGGRRRGDPRE